MKRWQKTVIVWSCHGDDLKTNIRVSDWPRSDEDRVYRISNLKATSLPDRQGKLEIDIVRPDGLGPKEPNRGAISLKLNDGIKDWVINVRGRMSLRISVKGPEEFSSTHTITLHLENGDQFCDTVLMVVRKVFRILGVEDETGHRLAYFRILQETYIQLDDAWIPFARWLRMNHQLPITGPEDIENGTWWPSVSGHYTE